MIRLAVTKKKTFGQRVISTAVWWGIPMLVLELIGIPHRAWGWVLLLVLPATALGVLVYAILEHGAIKYLSRRK
jgi:hypothetical protein